MTSLRNLTRRAYFFIFHFNIVLPPPPRLPKWYFPYCLRTRTLNKTFIFLVTANMPSFYLFEPSMSQNEFRFVIFHVYLLLRLRAVHIVSHFWIYILNGGLVTMFQVHVKTWGKVLLCVSVFKSLWQGYRKSHHILRICYFEGAFSKSKASNTVTSKE